MATGWRTVARSSQDAGDIRGTPYAWSVKRLAGTLSDGQVRAFLDEAEQMRVERGTGFAFLVEKRGGHRPPEWRVWLELATLSALIGGSPWSSPRHPVAVRADHLLDLLLAWEARHAAVGA